MRLDVKVESDGSSNGTRVWLVGSDRKEIEVTDAVLSVVWAHARGEQPKVILEMPVSSATLIGEEQ